MLLHRGPVREVDRVPLAEGEWTYGVWTGRDLVVDYRYLRNGSDLDLYGRVDLAGHITHNFENIDHVHVQAYFLDGAGNIIGSRGAMSSGWRSRLVGGYSIPFHTTMTLPPGTAALGFSYTGLAYSTDRGEGGTPYSFFGGP
jgi:hypothetical protein